MASILTLDLELTAWLEQRGQVTPPSSNGFRSISVSSYSQTSSLTDERMTVYPVVADSTATLELAGFSRSAAQEVFKNYERISQNPEYVHAGFDTELQTVARGYIEGRAHLKDACGQGDDWEGAWKGMGMSGERIQKLMKPEHDRMRLTKAASEHFREAIDSTLNYVFGLSNAVGRKKAKIAAAGQMKFNMRDMAVNLPQPHVQCEANIPREMEGHMMLYKGGDLERLERIWYEEHSSKTAFQLITSTYPTDFHPTEFFMFYTSPNLEVAEMYCRWHEDLKGDHILQGILHIACPVSLINRMNWIDEPQWSELVWASRRTPITPDEIGLPDHLLPFEECGYLAGRICGQATDAINRLERPDQLRDMKLSNGKEAIQYVFKGRTAIEELSEKCEGKFWLEERLASPSGPLKSTGKGRYRKKQETGRRKLRKTTRPS